MYPRNHKSFQRDLGMGTAIRTRIVKIGNSQGIRIPKPLLEASGICTEVEIEVQDDYLIVRAAPKSRVGWDEAFAAMAERRDDILLDDVNTTEWDHFEWEW
jgi:antitoxin MazE